MNLKRVLSKVVIFFLLTHQILVAQQSQIELDRELIARGFLATTRIRVIGGNLPHGHFGEVISHEGSMIDLHGVRRRVLLHFTPILERYNHWLLSVEIEEALSTGLRLAGSEAAHTPDLMIGFNNAAQLALLEHNDTLMESGLAFIDVTYELTAGEEASFTIELGLLGARGNYLTQFRGRRAAALQANGFPRR